MDPTTCWNEMNAAMRDGDFEQARDRAESLLTWLNCCGFAPRGGGRDEVACVCRAVLAGWTYETESPYDEEGVEGFLWSGPRCGEVSSFALGGDWRNGPEVPHEVRLEVDEEYRAGAYKRTADRRAFADFLGSLLGDGR